MGAGHAHALYVHGHTAIHRLPPETKVASALAFIVAVAITPREAIWAFGLYAMMLITVARIARVDGRFVAARLVTILPFVLFAFLVPFIGGGERVEIMGVAVSRSGVWAMWNIVAKATLGATSSILLAASTEVPEILRGMQRLRVPTLITAVATFMIRYLELTAEEFTRMRTAMVARGYNPRWLGDNRPLASSAGTLFIRSYERGERVHAAMLARGFTGEMPDLSGERASRGQWLAAASIPGIALFIAALAWWTR